MQSLIHALLTLICYFIIFVADMLLQALLDYERHNIKGDELNVPVASHPAEPIIIENQVICDLYLISISVNNNNVV